MPSFFNPNIWAGLVAFWELETSKEKAGQCSSARLTKVGGSDHPSKHVSGQISFEQRGYEIAVEKGVPATIPEVWEKTHRRPDGSWVDERVHQVHDAVIERVEELSTQPTPDGQPTQLTPMEINQIASQLAPRNRKGKMAFTGSIRMDDQGVPFCPVTRFASDPELRKELQETKTLLGETTTRLGETTTQLSETQKKLDETERRTATHDDMFAYLAMTNPGLAEFLRRPQPQADGGGTSTGRPEGGGEGGGEGDGEGGGDRDPLDDILFDD